METMLSAVCLALGLASLVQGQGSQQMSLVDILGPGAGPQSSANSINPNSVGQASFNTNYRGGLGNPTANRVGIAQNLRPFCTRQETEFLFNTCAMTFGMVHMDRFDYLRANRPVCRAAEAFRCNHVDNLVRCVNSQPVSRVSNNCWLNIRPLLTSFLHRYQIPCTFENIYEVCKKESQDIKPMDQRPQTGTGISNNPWDILRPMIQPILQRVMMMSMLSGGGGLMGLFGM